ncbi:hypothetical protein [Nesterenkonia sp. CF4.4]|uniref:hypothetical protein n=1 Tax=Nesterenkonia sp. CF4.4 TaxID=3373079 RepID=UPI003EE77DAE
MRFPASIIAFILGLLMAGIGVGLLTVWASDEVPTAQSEEVQDAPLTVISDEIVDPGAERDEFTINAEGEYTIALARTQDIEAWVGDAAHVTIGAVQEGADDAPSTIETQFTEGEATVPDPSGSDLWAVTETIEGDLRYRWSAPDDSGEWSLLIFRDGEEPAPSAVTVELPEEEDSPLGTVLIVIGSLLILVAIFLLYRALVARRRAGGIQQGGVQTSATHDSTPVAATGVTTATGAAAASGPTDTTAEDEMTQTEGRPERADRQDSQHDRVDRQDIDPADEELTGTLGSISTTESTRDAQDPDTTEEGRTWRSRSVATAAALALALSPAVLLADAENAAEDPAEDESAQTEDVEAEEVEAEEGEDAGYSVLLESQLQGIVDDIAETTAAADAEFNAELLSPRVSENAAEVRELTYRNHEIDEDVTPDAIGTEILSAAVTSATDFPRQAVVITQDADAEIPQVLVIEQKSPRENYELIQAVLMVPGTEFPAIAAEDGGAEPVDPDNEDARFAANHAMERVAVYLNNREYYFGMNVEDNAYIEDLQAYQEELSESAEDLSISYTRPSIEEGSTAMRLPDGSVIAVGSFDSTTQLRPEDGASINLSGVTAELAGTESITDDVDIVNRESMILHIPAEDDEKVVVLGVHDIVNEVNTLD